MTDLALVVVAEETRIDILAAQLLGSSVTNGPEQLWAANPGLAAEGLYVAAGRTIAVPRGSTSAAPALLPSVDPWN